MDIHIGVGFFAGCFFAIWGLILFINSCDQENRPETAALMLWSSLIVGVLALTKCAGGSV